jgi:hypothetical protein
MNEKDIKYYEETDFSDLLENSSTKRVVRPKNKRITINISENIFQRAHALDETMHMGYQNVLKAAMTLGLDQLSRAVEGRVNEEKPEYKNGK